MRKRFGINQEMNAIHFHEPKNRTMCNCGGHLILITKEREKVTCRLCLRFLGENTMPARIKKATGQPYQEERNQ